VIESADVLVVGAGPAGATAALNLAPTHSVMLADCSDLDSSASSVGESLAPAARRLLKDMGLLESFVAEDHSPWYGSRSVWGSSCPAESDMIRDLDGHGWHLDRARFDTWLRAVAVERGAVPVWRVRLLSVERDPSGYGWSVSLAGVEGRTMGIHARILIDATGKFGSLARRLGSHRRSSEERMVCAWLHGCASHETPATSGFTTVEAVEDGWWYTAPLPHGRRILAFHTDPDLPGRRSVNSTESLMLQTKRAPFLRSTLEECGFSANSAAVRWIVASGGTSWPPAGPGWVAAGDAAIHFDPLSSQGLLNALFTGLASAEAADRSLEGAEPKDVEEEYTSLIQGIWDAYRSHRQLWYRQEDRWPNATFWARRHRGVTPSGAI
jgi:flavin-dependent dehydrogenase